MDEILGKYHEPFFEKKIKPLLNFLEAYFDYAKNNTALSHINELKLYQIIPFQEYFILYIACFLFSIPKI